MPSEEELNISYLKQIKELASKRPNNAIEANIVGQILGLDDSQISHIESLLKDKGLIKESPNIAGATQLTSEGARAIRNASWWIRYSKLIKTFFQKYFIAPISDYKKSVFHGLLIFLIYEVFESFINIQLKEYWVEKILSRFHPNNLFDIAFLLFAVILIYTNYRRKIGTWDYNTPHFRDQKARLLS